jgi:hypothetical protein
VRGDFRPSRRLVLGAMLGAPVLAACTSPPPPPPPPDPLAALAAAARSDAAFADAVGSAVPALAAVATEVAKARGEHALALQKEVDRERPPKTSTPPSTSGAPAPDPATAKAALVDALTAAEKSAAELIASVSRYRAGLLGSVAAGCASLREVIG